MFRLPLPSTVTGGRCLVMLVRPQRIRQDARMLRNTPVNMKGLNDKFKQGETSSNLSFPSK
jgi:hypothetical protein